MSVLSTWVRLHCASPILEYAIKLLRKHSPKPSLLSCSSNRGRMYIPCCSYDILKGQGLDGTMILDIHAKLHCWFLWFCDKNMHRSKATSLHSQETWNRSKICQLFLAIKWIHGFEKFLLTRRLRPIQFHAKFRLDNSPFRLLLDFKPRWNKLTSWAGRSKGRVTLCE